MKTAAKLTHLALALVAFASCADTSPQIYNLSDYGLTPNSDKNATEVIAQILDDIKESGAPSTIVFEEGRYDFSPTTDSERTYYISNHDQTNPKNVGIPLEGMDHLTIEGNGADLIFHGRMIPLSIVESESVTVKGLSIDFEFPQNGQVEILENDTKNKKITFQVAPWMTYEFRGDDFILKNDPSESQEWENHLVSLIAFDGKTGHIVYRTSDIWYPVRDTEELGDGKVRVTWDCPKLSVGDKLAMRGRGRPSPGVFITLSNNTVLEDISVHYAEGMGLLAQMSKNIALNGFNVSLRGEDDPRCFTTQADATHFSGCKGLIISRNGLYENMMDDAINVHGTYLKIQKRLDDNTVEAEYMHRQAYGFLWGEVGDEVQFVLSNTMETATSVNKIKSIKAIDQPTEVGAKLFRISFEQPLPSIVDEKCGIENLTWTPEVIFSGNTIRNNRARGTLFSTPKRTLIEDNLFDHTSGTAILLCGDCNGWFETGACRDVVIRNNRFINALTNMFQFTNGVISIYPEIPNLEDQQRYFHGGIKDAILIENNRFEMFDKPIVYAKSVDGLTFRNNTIVENNDFEPFHEIQVPFLFERVINYKIENNHFEQGFDATKDVVVK